jgi:uncharacterized membrane protein
MHKFALVTFPEAASAQQGTSAIKALHAEGRIRIYRAVVVGRGQRGEMSLQEIIKRGHGAATAGALIGGLAGFALGPLAMIIGAAGGALIGHTAEILHEREAAGIVEKTFENLAPGKAKALLEIAESDLEEFVALMEPFGGATLRE